MFDVAPFFNDDVAATVVQVKGERGSLFALRLVNTTGAVAYLQIFGELAGNVVLGTTVPAWVIRLGANESLPFPMTVPVAIGPNGISMAGTTSPGGSSAAAISVAALVG